MKPTIRQHYVWRKYLRSWSTYVNGKDHIWALLKGQQNKIVKSNLMNVAQENGFYRLAPLSLTEIYWVKTFISQLPKMAQPSFITLVSLYEQYNALYENMLCEGKKIEDCPNLRRIELMLFEHFHTNIENMGDKLLDCKCAMELEQIAKGNIDDWCDVYCFLAMQYVRTKKMKLNLVQGYDGVPELSELCQKAFPLVAALTGMSIGLNLFRKDDSRFIFLHNQTAIPLVTGDQPIINVDADIVVDGHVAGWKLYYPISPNLAVLIDQIKDNSERFIDMSIDQDMVRYYNHIEYEEASDFVFSHVPEALKDL